MASLRQDFRQCPVPAVIWDGLPQRDSSGRGVSEVQQLEAVTERYLQHCYEHLKQDFRVPNTGEVLIQQLVQFGWLAWGGKHASNHWATSRISASYLAEPALVNKMNAYRRDVLDLCWQQQEEQQEEQQQQQQQQQQKKSPKKKDGKKSKHRVLQQVQGYRTGVKAASSSQHARETGSAGDVGRRTAAATVAAGPAAAAAKLGGVGMRLGTAAALPTTPAAARAAPAAPSPPAAAAAAAAAAGVSPAAPVAAAAAAQDFTLAPFSGSVPAVLEQLLELLEAIQAPDAQVEQLEAAVELLQGRQQLQPKQLETFCRQYKMLQAWLRRRRMDKVGPAVNALLRALGV